MLAEMKTMRQFSQQTRLQMYPQQGNRPQHPFPRGNPRENKGLRSPTLPLTPGYSLHVPYRSGITMISIPNQGARHAPFHEALILHISYHGSTGYNGVSSGWLDWRDPQNGKLMRLAFAFQMPLWPS
jgi:hypothetical protein